MAKMIPNDQYLRGIRLCRRNAKRLLRLADAAYAKKCYHAAFLLGFASLEETGKAVIILNHFKEEYITYDAYTNELRKHDIKIFEALKMINENILEVMNVGPRNLLFPNLKMLEPEKRDIKAITDNRLDSIYVDYDPEKGSWMRPIKDMERYAWDIMMKALDGYKCFLNECKHRDIKLRKYVLYPDS